MRGSSDGFINLSDQSPRQYGRTCALRFVSLVFSISQLKQMAWSNYLTVQMDQSYSTLQQSEMAHSKETTLLKDLVSPLSQVALHLQQATTTMNEIVCTIKAVIIIDHEDERQKPERSLQEVCQAHPSNPLPASSSSVHWIEEKQKEDVSMGLSFRSSPQEGQASSDSGELNAVIAKTVDEASRRKKSNDFGPQSHFNQLIQSNSSPEEKVKSSTIRLKELKMLLSHKQSSSPLQIKPFSDLMEETVQLYQSIIAGISKSTMKLLKSARLLDNEAFELYVLVRHGEKYPPRNLDQDYQFTVPTKNAIEWEKKRVQREKTSRKEWLAARDSKTMTTGKMMEEKQPCGSREQQREKPYVSKTSVKKETGACEKKYERE